MLIGVEHTTSFAYAAHISEAYTELRVRPLTGVHDVGHELGSAYFATRVDLPGPYSQQQQQ